jgi:hypothetical protein
MRVAPERHLHGGEVEAKLWVAFDSTSASR